MKYTKKEIQKMRDEIFENMLGAAIDDGVDDDEAQDAASDYTNGRTDKQIIKEYEEMKK